MCAINRATGRQSSERGVQRLEQHRARVAGQAIGASYVYAWDAKPATWQSNPDAYYDKNRTIEESAYSLDAVYTIQDGRAKGTMFTLHFTEYDNHSDIPSWGGGYGNIFQDERDVKFMVIAPFTIF